MKLPIVPLTAAICSFFALPLAAQEQSAKASNPFLSGNLYSRFALSYQHADDYYSGYDSNASSIFDDQDGEYTFVNYSVDLVYIMKNGLYIGSGLYASAVEVSTDGSGGIPDTDSNVELREIPLAIGYDKKVDDWRLRVEARYVFNVDDDFDGSLTSALADATLLPATDGSDSLTLSFRAKRNIWGLEHSLLFGYQIFEENVEHPLFPEFTLGDRVIVDYEMAKVMGNWKLSMGHLYSSSQETEGTYLTEKPRYTELRASANYRITPRFLADAGIKYIYYGKDAPKQETAFFGLAYLF